MKTKFLDSNIIVKAFYENENREHCQNAIKEGGITDTFCLSEAFHILEKIIDRKTAQESIKTLLKSNLEITDITTETIFEALKKTKKYNLNIFDIIHYTIALQNNCTTILSYDKDFNNLEIPRNEP